MDLKLALEIASDVRFKAVDEHLKAQAFQTLREWDATTPRTSALGFRLGEALRWIDPQG
jgi:hypothetical protein